MRNSVRFDKSCGGLVLVIAGALAVAGCGPTVNLNVSTSSPANECASLAEETIELSQQLLNIADETGEIDGVLACRLIENELLLLDGDCISEADLPEGVDRESLMQQQIEFSCPME